MSASRPNDAFEVPMSFTSAARAPRSHLSGVLCFPLRSSALLNLTPKISIQSGGLADYVLLKRISRSFLAMSLSMLARLTS